MDEEPGPGGASCDRRGGDSRTELIAGRWIDGASHIELIAGRWIASHIELIAGCWIDGASHFKLIAGRWIDSAHGPRHAHGGTN